MDLNPHRPQVVFPDDTAEWLTLGQVAALTERGYTTVTDARREGRLIAEWRHPASGTGKCWMVSRANALEWA